jgi:gamma-glutamyl-gamma-aminobutyrate hydrolase PuuD
MSEKKLCSLLEKILDYKVTQNKAFSWLKHRAPMRVDIYISALKIAVEYDVVLPDIFSEHSEYRLMQLHQKKIDNLKDRLIYKHIKEKGKDIKYFLRISYRDELTTENVRSILISAGVPC